MAERVAVGTSGYHSMRDLAVMDHKTPPPAHSVNQITGIPETVFETAHTKPFDMRFNI